MPMNDNDATLPLDPYAEQDKPDFGPTTPDDPYAEQDKPYFGPTVHDEPVDTPEPVYVAYCDVHEQTEPCPVCQSHADADDLGDDAADLDPEFDVPPFEAVCAACFTPLVDGYCTACAR